MTGTHILLSIIRKKIYLFKAIHIRWGERLYLISGTLQYQFHLLDTKIIQIIDGQTIRTHEFSDELLITRTLTILYTLVITILVFGSSTIFPFLQISSLLYSLFLSITLFKSYKTLIEREIISSLIVPLSRDIWLYGNGA